MRSRPSARRATRCASHILSNSVCAMASSASDRPGPLQRMPPTISPKKSPVLYCGMDVGGTIMSDRSPIGAIALVALGMTVLPACALQDTKYPDWAGQWKKPPNASDRPANPWDQTKPIGRGQAAPLTAEYQAIFQASLAGQERGAQGENTRYTCSPAGMPRVMTVVGPIDVVILPAITYIHFANNMPRRIYTDGRDWPKNEEPS